MAPTYLNFCFAALYCVSKSNMAMTAEAENATLADEEVERLLREGMIDAKKLEKYMAGLRFIQPGRDSIISLITLSSTMTVYESLPGASIALTIGESPLHKSSFVDFHQLIKLPIIQTDSLRHYELDRASKFSCIALCEYGAHNIHPAGFEHVFAMSSKNSIFVAAPLLDDPSRDDRHHEIRRVSGNIGRAGIAMMIAPPAPKVRTLAPDSWEQINHVPFDGQTTDSFQNTSLHLSFTQYTMPVNTGIHGGQDTETFLIETLVSVHDRGKWVADIDVLDLARNEFISKCKRTCSHSISDVAKDSASSFITIDNWEELLDREDVSAVVRAYQNPKACLATAIISANQKRLTEMVSGEPCWSCLSKGPEWPVTYFY